MSHNRDLSAAAGQFGFHSSNIGIGSEAPRYPLDVHGGNLLVSGSAAGNIILEDRGVGDSSRPFTLLASNDGNFTITNANRNASGTTTSSVERLRITSAGNVGIGSAVPANVLDVQGTTHTKIHVGTTGTGHATGIQINHAKGNAALQEWQLQTDGSADGNLKIRNATSATDVMFFDADNNNVGVNATNPDRKLEVVDTAGSLTYPVAVSNFTNASTGVGAAIDFRLTTGGNTRGELGLVYAGNSNSDGTDFVFKPNDGSTGNIERLRITNDGKIGIGHHSAAQIVKELTIRPANDGGIMIGRPGDTVTPINAHLLLTTTSAGQAFPSGEAYTVKYNTRNCDAIFTTYEGGGTGGNISFQTGVGNGNQAERLRITDAGYVLKSDTPAFQCKLSTATGANFNGYLVFNSVRFNIGNHYSSSNGRFTAPVDGRYLFSWYTNMLRDGGTGSLWADWYVNGGAQGNRMYTHYSGAWELIGGTIIMDLNSSDYVQIYTGTSGNWDGGSYGAFSGYLLG